jgi:hypothetical protein
MTITKTDMVDKIEVVSTGAGYALVQVRRSTAIIENGTEIARTFHRHVLTPDADMTGEDASVQAVAAAVFTDEAKAAYAAETAG